MAFETLHYMKHHQNGSSGYMTLKLDMSKAYDRIEWIYLEFLMKWIGFDDRWVALVMEWITTISYSILINGEPSQVIQPSGGIRQGDLLSHYLFLLCTEGLHSLMCQASEFGQIWGVSICKKGPRLTYLFFANNSLVFYKSSLFECHKIQDLLIYYEWPSSLQLNWSKTSLFFSKAKPLEKINQIKILLGWKRSSNMKSTLDYQL